MLSQSKKTLEFSGVGWRLEFCNASDFVVIWFNPVRGNSITDELQILYDLKLLLGEFNVVELAPFQKNPDPLEKLTFVFSPEEDIIHHLQ